MLTTRRHFLALAAAAPAFASVGYMANAASQTKIYSEDGIAIDGTDPVAYFTKGAPVPGDASITYDWQGATWLFSTTANRDAFAADPVAYAPQYGGYCAYAIAQGSLVSTIPEAWAIVDGKLYLNYSNRIQRRWERDMADYISQADARWPSLLG